MDKPIAIHPYDVKVLTDKEWTNDKSNKDTLQNNCEVIKETKIPSDFT